MHKGSRAIISVMSDADDVTVERVYSILWFVELWPIAQNQSIIMRFKVEVISLCCVTFHLATAELDIMA